MWRNIDDGPAFRIQSVIYVCCRRCKRRRVSGPCIVMAVGLYRKPSFYFFLSFFGAFVGYVSVRLCMFFCLCGEYCSTPEKKYDRAYTAFHRRNEMKTERKKEIGSERQRSATRMSTSARTCRMANRDFLFLRKHSHTHTYTQTHI